MKSRNSSASWLLRLFVATGIVTTANVQGGLGAPRDEKAYTLPPELEGRARILHVETVTPVELTDARTGLLAETEEPLVHPADVVIEVVNDEAVTRGRVGEGVIEAPVFVQMLDSGYGWYLNNAEGALQAHRMIFGNGWTPGEELTSFTARVYISSYNYGAYDGTGGFTIELWDGDPLGLFDVTCSVGGVPAPIPGTRCTYTDLPEDTVYDLKCVFEEKVQINCDRVFGVVHPGEVCRWAWRMSEGMMGWTPPQIGYGDGALAVWGCESFGYCPTPSGYNVGTCCDDQGGEPGEVPCDHRNADEGLWTPPGGCNPGVDTHPTFCMDDDGADYFFACYDEAPYYYNNFVGAAYAATDKYLSLTPVSADVPPDYNPTPDGWRIAGNEIILADPGRPVWLEVRVSDWDPDHTGLRLKAMSVSLDSSGYSNTPDDDPPPERPECVNDPECEALVGRGSVCEVPPDCLQAGWTCELCNAAGVPCLCTVGVDLYPYSPACETDADCEALLGPTGGGALKGGCNLPGHPPNVCAAGFVNDSRSDFVFYGVPILGGFDLSTLDYHWGMTVLTDPVENPHTGDLYAGTLVLVVPPGASGTFTVHLRDNPLWSCLLDENSQFIPLLGTVPAKITIGGSMIDPLIEKSRYLSFVSSVAGAETALRVTFKDLPAPYDAWNDTQMWAGPPDEYCENSGQRTPPAEGCGPAAGHTRTFLASTLQCEPYYMDWGAMDAVHVFHEGIVSGAAYDIQSIDIGQDPSVESNYSGPTELTTSRWGDLVKDCSTYPCGPPDGDVNITTDATVLIDKYRNIWGAPMQVRTDLVDFAGGPTPDQKTTIRDVVVTIDAFLGIGYPFTPGPRPCPP